MLWSFETVCMTPVCIATPFKASPMETVGLRFYCYQNDDKTGLSKRVKTYVTSPNIQLNTVY
jgi:hypothetical protein